MTELRLAGKPLPPPPLPGENAELARSGDLHGLALRNLRLAVRRARSYSRINGLPVDDLLQVAYLGLLKAARTYDPDRGAFSTWSDYYLKNALSRFCVKATPFRAGSFALTKAAMFRHAIAVQTMGSGGVDATDSRVGEHLGFDARDYAYAREGLKPNVGLSRPSGPRPAEVPERTDEIFRERVLAETRECIASFRRALSPRDAQLVDERLLGDPPKILQAFAREWGVSRQAVHLREQKLKRLLRTRVSETIGTEMVLEFLRTEVH